MSLKLAEGFKMRGVRMSFDPCSRTDKCSSADEQFVNA